MRGIMGSYLGNAPIANNNYSIANGASSTSPLLTVLMTRDPTSNDINYQVKQRWVNTDAHSEWILTGFTQSNNTTVSNWMQLSDGDAILEIGVPNGSSPIAPDSNGLVNFTSTLDTITITGSNGGTGLQNINFDIADYENSVWTPTVIGGTTPGTTVYGVQFGYFVRLASIIQVEFTVTVGSATGTGNLVIGGLPYPINVQASGNVIGSVISVGALTWPVGTTSIALLGSPGNSFLTILASGSGVAGGNIQIANTVMNIQGSIVYEI